jgi:hypothetical protein
LECRSKYIGIKRERIKKGIDRKESALESGKYDPVSPKFFFKGDPNAVPFSKLKGSNNEKN